MAEVGLELEDILTRLEVSEEQLKDVAVRQRVERAFMVGRVELKFRIADRLRREGVFKGRATALLALGRTFLNIDKDVDVDAAVVEQGILERLEGALVAVGKGRTT